MLNPLRRSPSKRIFPPLAGTGDVVAERAVALGAAPDGQAAAVAAQSALSAVEPGPIADSLVVETLARQIADVAARARERMDRLGDIDAASQDVLTDVVRSLEEQLWMVRAQHAPAGSN